MTTAQMPVPDGDLSPPEPAPGWDPGPTGIGYAVRRRWLTVLVSVLVCTGAGAAVGLVRKPTFTAQTKLSVGRINLAAPGAISGYAQATQTLAAGSSRTIDADAVVQSVARRSGLSAATVRNRLSATPVPESPVFRVEATSRHRADAIRLANLASDALLAYITDLNQSSPDASRLYEDFKDAAKDANAHRATQRRLTDLIAATRRPPSDPAALWCVPGRQSTRLNCALKRSDRPIRRRWQTNQAPS